jgi:hypothetical protein
MSDTVLLLRPGDRVVLTIVGVGADVAAQLPPAESDPFTPAPVTGVSVSIQRPNEPLEEVEDRQVDGAEELTPLPAPGRSGYSREQYEWLVEQYRRAQRDNPRAPVHLLARRIGRHPVTTGRMLTRARKLGLLTDSGL